MVISIIIVINYFYNHIGRERAVQRLSDSWYLLITYDTGNITGRCTVHFFFRKVRYLEYLYVHFRKCLWWERESAIFHFILEFLERPNNTLAKYGNPKCNNNIITTILFYLKSGMPADVLIPAPVWKTVYLDSLIQSPRSEIFFFNSSGLSKIWNINKRYFKLLKINIYL